MNIFVDIRYQLLHQQMENYLNLEKYFEYDLKWNQEREIYENNLKSLKDKKAKFDINLKKEWLLNQSLGLKNYIEYNIITNILKNQKEKYFYWIFEDITFKTNDIFKIYKYTLFEYIYFDKKTSIEKIINDNWIDDFTNILHNNYSFSNVLKKIMEDDFGVNEIDEEDVNKFISGNNKIINLL